MIQKEYISKDHSKFLIKYHMIPVCKYRKKLLIGAVEYDMKQIMQKISNFSYFDIEVMETDKDPYTWWYAANQNSLRYKS